MCAVLAHHSLLLVVDVVASCSWDGVNRLHAVLSLSMCWVGRAKDTVRFGLMPLQVGLIPTRALLMWERVRWNIGWLVGASIVLGTMGQGRSTVTLGDAALLATLGARTGGVALLATIGDGVVATLVGVASFFMECG